MPPLALLPSFKLSVGLPFIASFQARAEALLSAQREAEQLHARAAYSEAKESELAKLRSKAKRLESEATHLHRSVRMLRAMLTASGRRGTNCKGSSVI